MGFTAIDYIVVILYLIVIAVFGILQSGKQRSAKDYFLGKDQIHWFVVCLSIVAAETSALTFISIPGLAYMTNLGFLQLTFGYLLGRIAIAYLFLPSYFKGELATAYAFLERRFGRKTRSFASIIFMLTRLAADGVRLFATAIPLKMILGIDYIWAILLIAAVAFVYTYTGGIRSAIWVDMVQMAIHVGGAIAAAWLLAAGAGGLSNSLQLAVDAGKTQLFSFHLGVDFFQKPYTFIAGILGGMFLSMASHGTDQLIIQRVLAAKTLSGGRKAIIGSGIIAITQFALFLFLGLMLYGKYNGAGLAQLGLTRSDELFPLFIIQGLPPGVSGFLIAALLATALSALAGSITSLGSALVLDIYKPYFAPNMEPEKELKFARSITILWVTLLVCSALFFMNSTAAVVERALSIASFTYGGLLGTFLLGVLFKRPQQEDALAAFVAGIFGMVVVISLNLVAWTWFTLIGVLITLVVGNLLSLLSRRPAPDQQA